MDRELKLPYFVRVSIVLLGLLAFIAMMYYTRPIVVPFIFAVVIAIVLHPLESFFSRLRINRIASIILTLTITVLAVTGLGIFIILQVTKFTESMPELVAKFESLITDLIFRISGMFDLSTDKVSEWIASTKSDLFDQTGPALGKTLITMGNAFVIILLVPVYVFMIMYYEPLILEFLRRSFHAEHRKKVSQVITEIKNLIQSYLSGLFIEMAIVAALDTAALIILGVDYAILLGILAAILNLIPYLGGIVGAALPMMIALATKESPWTALWVLISFYIIQLIDNNYIVPKIVASKVKINALVSVFVVLAFGALWGIPGMFISIPLTAIVKLISDHIDPLKPFGYLLGDAMPSRHPFTKKPLDEKTVEKQVREGGTVTDISKEGQ